MLTYKKILKEEAPADTFRELHEAGKLGNFFPELAALDMKDAVARRHKNNFHHSLAVLEQAIELEPNGPDLTLRTAALLHDIGKPATRAFDGKTVSFTNHETVGARMARKILRINSYSKVEADEIVKLIALHMRSFGYDDDKWSDTAARRLFADVGSLKQLDRLFIIFNADVTTKHDEKRKKIHAGVDAYYKLILDTLEKDKLAARRPAIDGNRVMELTGLQPGRELGEVMRFLNSEEGLALSKEEAIAYVLSS